MSSEVLAEIRASAARRWFGIVAMMGLGGLLVYVALVRPPEFGWQVFLIVMGLAALWTGERTRRATEHAIELTKEGLRDTSGEVIAPLSEIAKVNRGMFAMKPSNGFTVVLKNKGPGRWRPGLWWSLGRRIGVGGVTPGHQAKALAQVLEILLVERDQEFQ